MRFLVIGAGAAGRFHSEQLGRDRGHEVFIYDTDEEKAEQLAAEYPAEVVRTDEGEYDCAVIAVPANAHFEVAHRQILLGRKAIVCEKPLCLRTEDAESLCEMAEAEGKGIQLLVAESQCYAGQDGLAVLDAAKRISDGEFGTPVLWRVCAMTKYRPQEWCDNLSVGGGAFIEGGIHILTTARVLFGDAVRWQGSVRCFSGGTGPDSGTFLIDYEGGHQLTLQIGWGTEGCFEGQCEPLDNSAGLFGPKRCEEWWPGDNHRAMWSHLLKCLRREAEPVATLHHAAGAVYDAWECYKAAEVKL